MSRSGQRRRRISGEQTEALTRVEIADVGSAARRVEADDLIQEPPAVGQKLRPGERDVARVPVELGNHLDVRVAARGNRVEAARPEREQNRIVGSPAAAGHDDIDIGHVPDRSTDDVDRHQFAVGKEADAPRVGRPERFRRIVGSREPLERARLQRTHPQRILAG